MTPQWRHSAHDRLEGRLREVVEKESKCWFEEGREGEWSSRGGLQYMVLKLFRRISKKVNSKRRCVWVLHTDKGTRNTSNCLECWIVLQKAMCIAAFACLFKKNSFFSNQVTQFFDWKISVFVCMAWPSQIKWDSLKCKLRSDRKAYIQMSKLKENVTNQFLLQLTHMPVSGLEEDCVRLFLKQDAATFCNLYKQYSWFFLKNLRYIWDQKDQYCIL